MTTALTCEVTLPGVAESVREFRALARQLAATPGQAEAAALCVSELVTNAIVHTRSGQPGGTVSVTIGPADLPGELRITVTDGGNPLWPSWSSAGRPSWPAMPAAEAPDVPEHGYGLAVVDAVAADWGRFGWSTWCEIPGEDA